MLLRSKFGIFGNLCVPEKTPLIDMLRFGIYSKLTDLPIINGSPVMEDSILWLNFNVLGSHRLNNVMYAFRAEMDNHIFIHCTYSKWYLDCLMARLDITIQNETWLQLLDFILEMEDRRGFCRFYVLSKYFVIIFGENGTLGLIIGVFLVHASFPGESLLMWRQEYMAIECCNNLVSLLCYFLSQCWRLISCPFFLMLIYTNLAKKINIITKISEKIYEDDTK